MPKVSQSASPRTSPPAEPETHEVGGGLARPRVAVGAGIDLAVTNLLAIDPGDVHVGMAEFGLENGQPVCVWAEEYSPDDAADLVVRRLQEGLLGYLVVERFSLYADKAMAQVGSQMLTSELIGVLKFLTVRNNRQVEKVAAGGYMWEPWDPTTGLNQAHLRPVQFWLQGADIKKGIRAQIDARGITRQSPKNTHHGDAEEHGWYRILRGQDNDKQGA